MKTKYQMNKDVLIMELTLKNEFNFKKDLNYLYNYLNIFFKINKIKFKGKKIIISINGINRGTIYLTSYYFKKKYNLLNKSNCYFIEHKVMEIKPL